jgi:hypothetical protein
MTRESDYVVARLKKLAKKERGRFGELGPPVLSPTEQMRRFFSGEEFARVQRGEVTPTGYHEYQREMLKRLGMEV